MSGYLRWPLLLCGTVLAFVVALWFHFLTSQTFGYPSVSRFLAQNIHIPATPHISARYTQIRNCSGLAPAPRPPCTLPLLKSVFLKNNYFPDCLEWTPQMTFRPEFCDLPAPSSASLARCLTGKSVRRVALLGDSNIVRVTKAFMAALGLKCRVVKMEGRIGSPDTAYYGNDNRGRVTHARGCTGCLSAKYRCPTGNGSLIVEYVSMEYIWDTEITTFRTLQGLDCYEKKRPCPEAHSTQQFIYKQYFPLSGYPDLILHFLSNHDKATSLPAEVLMGAETLGRMLELYVPLDSRVVLFGKMYEEMQYKPTKWQQVKYEERYNTPQQIRRLNKAAALGLRRAVAECPRIDVYFDLFTYGEGVAKQWGLDGVHKKAVWYRNFVEYFARVLCTS